jgi:hypothetical protein
LLAHLRLVTPNFVAVNRWRNILWRGFRYGLLELVELPRGRKRQTPREAWFESAGRILERLSERSAKGFNQLLDETRLSPTTLSSHLRGLANENKIIKDVRTGLYRRTQGGDRWLEVPAIVQRILQSAKTAGSVGPSKGGDVYASATSACAMPSPGPSGLAEIADEVPGLLARILVEDRVRRGLVTGLVGNHALGVKETGDILRALPRIFVLEVQWERVADGLDRQSSQDLWRDVLSRKVLGFRSETVPQRCPRSPKGTR